MLDLLVLGALDEVEEMELEVLEVLGLGIEVVEL